MAAQVPINIGPPNILIFPIAEVAGLDLTTVTAVSFTVLLQDGVTQVTWTGVIPSTVPANTTQYSSLAGQPNPVNSTLMFATHAFATPDCVAAGTYMVAPQLTVPGGTVPCYARPLQVTSIFGM